MEASFRKAKTGSGMVKWRLHTHFELLRGVPTRIDVTPDGGGPHDERAMLEATIEADRLYVTDRGYAKFLLFNKIVAVGSSYVCRLRDNSVWKTVTTNYRNDNAGLNEIISDEIVEFKGTGDRKLDHKVRVICARMNPHTARSARQVFQWFQWSGQRRNSSHRHKLAGRASGWRFESKPG